MSSPNYSKLWLVKFYLSDSLRVNPFLHVTYFLHVTSLEKCKFFFSQENSSNFDF